MTKYMRISSPAHTFVSLWTIRRNIDKITFLRPPYIFRKTIQELMITGKVSDKLFYRRILETFHFIDLRRIGYTADFNITIPMERKLRLIYFSISSTTDINICTGGITIIFQHHLSFITGIFRHIRIQNFRIPQNYFCSRFFMKCDTRNTCHFLFQIINVNSRFLFFSGLCTSSVHHIDRRIIFSHQPGLLLINGRPGAAKSRRHSTELVNRHRIHLNRCFPLTVIKISQ